MVCWCPIHLSLTCPITPPPTTRRLMESLSFAEERASGQMSHQLGSGMYSKASPARTLLSSNPHRTSRRDDIFSSNFSSPAQREGGAKERFHPSASEGTRDGHFRGNQIGFKSLPLKRQEHLRRTGSSEYLRVGGLEQGGVRDTTGGPDFSGLSAGTVGYTLRSSSLQPSPGSHGNRRTGEGSGDTRLWIKLEAAETRLRQYESEVGLCRATAAACLGTYTTTSVVTPKVVGSSLVGHHRKAWLVKRPL